MARVAKEDWAALTDQEWFLYDYVQGKLVLKPSGGAIAEKNAEESDGEGRSQTVVRVWSAKQKLCCFVMCYFPTVNLDASKINFNIHYSVSSSDS